VGLRKHKVGRADMRRSRELVRKLPRQVIIAGYVARTLALEAFIVGVRVPGTDLDLVGIRDESIVVAEVKRRLGPWNIDRAVLQLDFRRLLSHETYLAIPKEDVWYALAMIPSQYGIVSFSRDGVARIARPARVRHSPPYTNMLRMMFT